MPRTLTTWLLALLITLAMAAPAQAVRESKLSVKRVDLLTGHSKLLDLPREVKRVSVGRAEVADVTVVAPRQVYVNAISPGTTNVTMWDDEDKLLAVVDIRVSRDLSRLKRHLFQIMPNEPVEVREVEGFILLSGKVSSIAAKLRAGKVAQSITPEHPEFVTNTLEVGGNQQVKIEVRFAEVSKAITNNWNLNILAFNPFTGDMLWTLFGNLVNPFNMSFSADERDKDPNHNDPTAFNTNKRHTWSSEFDMNPNINGMFSFKSGQTRFAGFLDILKENGLVKVLAEPTIVAASGQEASFLAGGEFPVPVPQKDSITIEWKPFGVQLSFKPEVTDRGTIKMAIAPEVSDLDFTTSLVIEGFTIPGITTRRARTQIELKDGQSFIMAGMFRDDITENIAKYPWLGDVPVLGALFRSTDYQNNRTELLIMVTPKLVKPGQGAPPAVLPTDGWVPPSADDQFLLGKATTRHAPIAVPRSLRELEGRFGHDMVY